MTFKKKQPAALALAPAKAVAALAAPQETATVTPEATPKPAPKVKGKTGPRLAKLADLSEFAASLQLMTPAQRKLHRTQQAELTFDLFAHRLTSMLQSDTCRAQTLVVASGWLRSNDFSVSPDSEGEIDPLEQIMIRKREAEKAEQIRLRNMEREKKKRIAAEEARSIAFFQRIDNPTEPTPRLNTSAPGRLTNDDNEGEDSNE